jgi:hypothetical protein
MSRSLLAVVMLVLLCSVGIAQAETTDTVYQFRNSVWDWSPFVIDPFDTTLGTLNSVTMLVELNVSGVTSLSTPEETGVYGDFRVVLDAMPEMGWEDTEATCGGYGEPLWFDEYAGESGEWQSGLSESGNTYLGPDTIYADFGRFLGTDPFEIELSLFGDAWTEGSGTPVSAYDGNAHLEYWYDYTPGVVPEPSSLLCLLCGIGGMGGLVRRRMSA